MIDTLVRLLPEALERVSLTESTKDTKGGFVVSGFPKGYALVTLHRPSNVDDPGKLARIMEQLEKVAKDMPVLFPVHPRTAQLLAKDEIGNLRPEVNQKNIKDAAASISSLRFQVSGLIFLPPLGYLDFLALQANAAIVITDSGGIQEETSYLGVPCLTVRNNTERPVTIEKGTNRLIKISQIAREVEVIRKDETGNLRPEGGGREGGRKDDNFSSFKFQVSGFPGHRPSIPLWDGHAAERIVAVMKGGVSRFST